MKCPKCGHEPGLDLDVVCTTDRVIDKLNRVAGRRLTPGPYRRRVERLLKQGYTEAEMRLVIWWAWREWGREKPKWVNPSTLFKLVSSHGGRTFPEYLSVALEAWFEKWPSFDRGKTFE
jgi:hypothetical protein